MKHWYEKKRQIFHRLNMNGLQTNFARIRHLVFIAIGLFLVIDNSFACSGSLNYNSGTICANGTAEIVFQGGSAGVTYQLYKDDNAIGSTINTGGASIYYISVTGVGSYQLKLSIGNTNVCTSWSSNTVTVGLKSGASISINASPSSAICRGQSVTLTAAGGYGYSWSSQVVSPLVNTTYTLTGTESACNTLSTATITVYVSPAVGQVNITAGPTSVCQGTITSSTYTASATDVNYYDWTISPPGMGTGQAGTINAITGVVTWNPNFSGTARVSVKATSGQYCMTTTNSFRDVTVMAMPSAPATSSISVPYNSTITLQASGAGTNEEYRWYTSQSATTPIHSSVGPLNTAASTYTYYAGKKNTLTGCETLPGQRSVLTVTVYIDPPGTPIISTNTCGPRTITLTPPPANCTYYWEGSDPKGTNLGSPIINGIFEVPASGDFYIRSNVNGTDLWSAAIKISVTVDPVDITINSYDPSNPVAQATYSITFGEGFEVPAGSTFSANIVITSECNDFVNWTEQILYDQNGVAISDSRSYFDGFGGGIENQSKDFFSKKVFASQPIFDIYNTAAGASLPAPILESDFIYKKAVISNAGGTPYTADDFDKRTTTNVSGSGEINYPKVVGTQPGTTGWYYSSSNNIEPNTPVTSYPYSRDFTPEGPDPKESTSASAGDEFRMGSGHETKSEKTLISTDDASKLSHYYSLRHFFSNSTTVTGKGYRYISTDANGKQAVSFVDADGRSIASAMATLVSGMVYNYDYWNYTYYNDAGQVTATVAPKDVIINNTSTKPPVTEFYYDHLGRLIETSSPDEGTSRFVYSIDGKIRFSENQVQRDGGTKRFSYTNYDNLGRPVESGEYTATTGGYLFEPHSTITPASNSVLNIVDNNFTVPIEQVNSGNFTGVSEKLDAARCSEHNFITYDEPGSGSPAAQDFLLGQISKTENDNAITWYSYDEDGLLVWMKQNIPGLGIKSINYIYDYFGNVTLVAYQREQPDAFYHHYTYDINQRLTEVFTSKDPVNKTLHAKYYYYLHGPLKRVELAGNLQGMDYVYTIDGSLKSINHADVSKDPGGDGSNGVSADVFGETLDYHSDDYQGAGYNAGIFTGTGTTNYYNGLIKSASWFTPVDAPSAKKAYRYTYDNQYQFQNAEFGSVTETVVPGVYSGAFSSTAYREGIPDKTGSGGKPGYDKNGNINYLIRKDKLANTVDDFTYNYSNNRLMNITGSSSINYTYNLVGQLTSMVEGGKTLNFAYNAYGLTKSIQSVNENLTMTYSYDDRGNLIKRSLIDGSLNVKSTWYVHDVAGNIMAIYDQPVSGAAVLSELPIYGSGRIGTYNPAKQTTFYEINDHLGNVRAVIGKPGTDVYTATMETENMIAEDKRFKNIIPRYPSTAANNTPGGNEVIRVNNGQPLGGYDGRSVGPAIILHVSPGDVISTEVYGYYEGGTGYSNTLPIATIANAVATAFGGINGAAGDPGKIFSSLNSYLTGSSGIAGTSGSPEDTSPAAYLNMIMFDENMNADGNVLPMSAKRLTGDANMNRQLLTIGPINIPAPGYVYIYVNNNSDVSNWVYFDDLKVTHLRSPFVAGGDYYPFGMEMSDRQIEVENYRYGYQGQYAQMDSITGFNEFDLRMYDSRIGRWISPDPYGQYASPYVGMGNNPVSGTDPDGGFTVVPPKGTFWNELLQSYQFYESAVVSGVKSVSTSFLSGTGVLGVVLRGGGNFIKDGFIGATTIANGIGRSVAGDYLSEFGGNSKQSRLLRWQGYMFGVGVQVIISYGRFNGNPSGMPSMSPSGSIAIPVAIPVTTPATVPVVTTLDGNGLVYSKDDLGKKPKPRSYDKPIGRRFKFSSRKGAYESAKNAGEGEPVLHGDGEHGPHYHPGDGKGRPLNHDHYYFPKKQF